MRCSQCGVCCKLFLINLTEKEYKSLRYKTQFEEFERVEDFSEAELCGANIITQREDGSCIYLENGNCSIHDKRPEACRAFFCDSKNPKFKVMIEKINEFDLDHGLNKSEK
jgi:Fe-S-cluster containining protein